jgi:hypothetical protein
MATIKCFWGFGRIRDDPAEAESTDASTVGADPAIAEETLLISPQNMSRGRPNAVHEGTLRIFSWLSALSCLLR